MKSNLFISILIAIIFSMIFSGCFQRKPDYIRRILKHEKSGNYEKALLEAEEMLLKFKMDRVGTFLRGRINRKLGNYSESIKDLSRVESGDNGGLANAFWDNTMGNTPKPRPKPMFSPEMVSFELGISQMLISNFNAAIDEFNYCIEKNYLESGYVFHLRGRCYVAMNLIEAGCQDFKTSIESLKTEILKEESSLLFEKYCK